MTPYLQMKLYLDSKNDLPCLNKVPSTMICKVTCQGIYILQCYLIPLFILLLGYHVYRNYFCQAIVFFFSWPECLCNWHLMIWCLLGDVVIVFWASILCSAPCLLNHKIHFLNCIISHFVSGELPSRSAVLFFLFSSHLGGRGDY